MDQVINELGLSNAPSLYKYFSHQDIDSLPLRVNKSLHAMDIHPHSIFVIDNKPIILFFKATVDYKKVFKQCWNFSEAPIIIIEKESSFEIYNGFEYILKNGELLLDKLNKNNLNYISLLSGQYLQSIKSFQYKNNRLDRKLLDNIRDARQELLKTGLPKEIANGLLGRIIFIRYLIDRKIMLNFDGQKKLLTNDDLKKILMNQGQTYKLFKYLKSTNGFNGDWFPIIDDPKRNLYEEQLVVDEHLQILRDLISGTEIKTKQQSLFDFYDFSIIPIEFISNVYESFIGEDEQSKNGAYYTPTFLVDYILKYTVDEYFKKNPKEYNCKVLDPACGSGIFLVETLRKLIKQFEKVKNRRIEPSEIVKLVEDNIFAIDKDRNAILISVFSIYLTMLDYQDPKDIEQFVFPYLLESPKNSSPNFFENDFFDTNAAFNTIIKDKKIHFIIGNPPYKRGAGNSKKLLHFLKIRSQSENTKIDIGNKEIAQAFMIRSSDINHDANISFIVNSKNFYNIQSQQFRKYFLNHYSINHILELSSVRNEVFPTATTPVLIIFYQFRVKESQLIKYISIKPNPIFSKFKMLCISKQDYKKVLQKKLLEHDYLWKTLIYGTYIDFSSIKRLKHFTTINNQIVHKAQGITVGGSDKNPTDDYAGMPFVETKQFKNCYINENENFWEPKLVHRNKDIELFKSPSLLISKGISKNLTMKIGILQRNSIFTDSITAVKCSNKDTLYNIMGILNSSLFKYLIMHTGSSIGTEREQVHNPEKFNIPYVYSQETISITKKIEQLSSEQSILHDDNNFNLLQDKLDKSVLNDFNLNDQELSCVAYTTDILIPWIMKKDYSQVFRNLNLSHIDDKELIKSYVQIYTDYFSKLYENNKSLNIKIMHNRYAIAIFFKTTDTRASNIQWIEEPNISNFIKISSNKILENLFIQKDLKGFEKDGFYIIKTNEAKNWHKAIGYLDFFEFKDAILRAGQLQWRN